MTSQINVRLPENLEKAASAYATKFGYSNIQELIKEAVREKIYGEKIAFLQEQAKKAIKGKKYTRKELGF